MKATVLQSGMDFGFELVGLDFELVGFFLKKADYAEVTAL